LFDPYAPKEKSFNFNNIIQNQNTNNSKSWGLMEIIKMAKTMKEIRMKMKIRKTKKIKKMIIQVMVDKLI
jgi:hypothetical protein